MVFWTSKNTGLQGALVKKAGKTAVVRALLAWYGRARRGIERSELLSGLACGAVSRLDTIAHTVTHHRITLDVVSCTAGRGGKASPGRRWVTATALASLAMTSPGRRITRMLG